MIDSIRGRNLLSLDSLSADAIVEVLDTAERFVEVNQRSIKKVPALKGRVVASLFFEVTDSEDPIEVGGVTEYIVRIANQGTKAASGVRLTATLLGDLEPVDAKGPAAHRVENLTVIFDPLARLAPTEEVVFRVRVRGRREGDQRMQVQLVSDDHPAPITKEEITRVYADR